MAEKKTIKLEDVAELAGVSKTTVSRVLNNRGYLSDKTIKKVHDAMDELNYRPNVIARQLFKQKTNLVAFVFVQYPLGLTLEIIKVSVLGGILYCKLFNY